MYPEIQPVFEVKNIPYKFLFLLIILVYMVGAFVDVMDVDSGQYASMAREMIASGNWMHFTDRGIPYLDKPPFIFWISGLSYVLLGISNFSFKLPAILCSIAGIYATYRFANIYFNRQTGLLAAIILASSQAYFHFNNDVRTDVYLTNFIILGMWQMAEFIDNHKRFAWIFAFIFFGLSLLAKGPLGLMLPALAYGVTWLITANWKNIFRWQWLAGIVVAFIVISPMLWGLYTQFDLQPELEVNGKTNTSGLRFFFWEQSFGRLTGENVWKNDTGPFFFVHNLLWSFLPWTIFLLIALVSAFTEILRKRKSANKEREGLMICIAGSVLTFIALSASAYKLPHYIYVIFPLLAVITADWICKWLVTKQHIQIFKGFNWFFLGLALLLVLLISLWVFQNNRSWTLVLSLTIFALAIAKSIHIRKDSANLISGLTLSIIAFNLCMNLHFYPSLLAYQAPGRIARFINEEGINPNQVYNYKVGGRSLDLYTRSIVKDFQYAEFSDASKQFYLHCDQEGLQELKKIGYQTDVLCAFEDITVTMLNIKFINPSTRKDAVNIRYLVKIRPNT